MQRTDNVRKLTVAFRIFANAPKTTTTTTKHIHNAETTFCQKITRNKNCTLVNTIRKWRKENITSNTFYKKSAKTTVHKIQDHLYCLPAFLKYTYLKMTYAGRNMLWFLRNYLQYNTDCRDGWKKPYHLSIRVALSSTTGCQQWRNALCVQELVSGHFSVEILL